MTFEGCKIEGLQRTIQNLSRIHPAIKQFMGHGIEKCCLFVEGDAKQICPWLEGLLSSSINFVVDYELLIGVVGTNVYYSVYVELGTWKMEAQPFLGPAYDNNYHVITGILANAYADACRSITGGGYW